MTRKIRNLRTRGHEAKKASHKASQASFERFMDSMMGRATLTTEETARINEWGMK